MRPTNPTTDPQNNPGGARWCPEHERLECTKGRVGRRIGNCHQVATDGTDSCPNHSTLSKDLLVAQGEAVITAWNAIGRPEGEHVDPGAAVLGVLQMSWLRLSAYSQMLRRQIELESTRGAGAVIEQDGEPAELGPKGLIGHRMGMGGKDGILYEQNEEIRALVALEAAERDRVVRYAKVAHDMGISERMTSMAEQWGDVVAGRVSQILDGLNLTPAQMAKVPGLVQLHLGSVDLS